MSQTNTLEKLSTNLSGKVRREHRNGREYLVAPASLIVPGVLNGSKGPLYYPEEEIGKNYLAWNDMPIVLDHPVDKSGQPISARDPSVLEKFGLGRVYNAKVDGKLESELWFDVVDTRRIAPSIISRLEGNQPIELSTGLFTSNETKKGDFNGKPYEGIARNYQPDHLAILPNKVGACSIKDGCGVLANEEKTSLWTKLGELLGIINNSDNCGTGAGGFKEGNTCAKGGSGKPEKGTQGSLQGRSVTDPKPGEKASDYIERMMGAPGSKMREAGAEETYPYWLQKWDAAQSKPTESTKPTKTPKAEKPKKDVDTSKTLSKDLKGLRAKSVADDHGTRYTLPKGTRQETIIKHLEGKGWKKAAVKDFGTDSYKYRGADVHMEKLSSKINVSTGSAGTTSIFVHNNEGDSKVTKPKPLTNDERSDVLDQIIANCECWEESDRDTLAKMNDGQLNNLLSNGCGPDDDEEEMEDDEEDEGESRSPKSVMNALKEMPEKDRAKLLKKIGVTVVTNEAKPAKKSSQQWFDEAPEDVRSVVANAIQFQAEQKKALITQIVTNSGKKLTKEFLEGKEVNELKTLLAALPAPQQKADPVANFFGASAPFSGAPTANAVSFKEDEDTDMAPPTINWTEMASEGLRNTLQKTSKN